MPLLQQSNHYNRRKLCGYGTAFDAKHWLTLEVSGCYGISFSLFIHVYAFIILWYEVVLHDTETRLITTLCSNLLFYVFYVPIALLAVASLLQATLTDPGAVPMGAQPFVKVRRILSHRTSSTTDLLPPPTHSSSNVEGVVDELHTRNDTSKSNNSTPIPTDGNFTNVPLTSSTAQNVPTTTTAVTNDDSSSIRRCYKCNDNYKPARAHHDSVTGRCIVKFDHYCPWVNNAIGVLNHKFFCLFLFYTALSCVVSLLLLFLHYIHCIPYNHYHNENNETNMNMNSASSVGEAVPVRQHENMNDSTTTRNSVINGHNQGLVFDPDGNRRYFLRRILLSSTEENISTNSISNGAEQCQDFFQRYTIIALLIISCIFFIFTVIMILEQIDTIRTGKGKIARMKQRVGASGCTEYETVTEEFNEMFGGTSPNLAWHWFVPIQVRYPKKMKQVVLGYEFNLNTCNPCAPYGMESATTTTTTSDIVVSNGCDESIPLSRSSSMNNNDDTMTDVDLESNIVSSTRDGLMKSGTIITSTKTMKKPPAVSPPIPNGEGIFRRELSNDSTLNRRTNRNMNGISSDPDGSPEGITLVERSRTRIT
jgi:DHHC palmitoyltransferase